MENTILLYQLIIRMQEFPSQKKTMFSKQKILDMYARIDLDSPRTLRICRKLKITQQLLNLKKPEDFINDKKNQPLKDVRYEFYLRHIYKLILQVQQQQKKRSTVRISHYRLSTSANKINTNHPQQQDNKMFFSPQNYVEQKNYKKWKLKKQEYYEQLKKLKYRNECTEKNNKEIIKNIQLKMLEYQDKRANHRQHILNIKNQVQKKNNEKQRIIQINQSCQQKMDKIKKKAQKLRKIQEFQLKKNEDWQNNSNIYRKKLQIQNLSNKQFYKKQKSDQGKKKQKFIKILSPKNQNNTQIPHSDFFINNSSITNTFNELKFNKIKQRLATAQQRHNSYLKQKVDSLIKHHNKFIQVQKNNLIKNLEEEEDNYQKIICKSIEKLNYILQKNKKKERDGCTVGVSRSIKNICNNTAKTNFNNTFQSHNLQNIDKKTNKIQNIQHSSTINVFKKQIQTPLIYSKTTNNLHCFSTINNQFSYSPLQKKILISKQRQRLVKEEIQKNRTEQKQNEQKKRLKLINKIRIKNMELQKIRREKQVMKQHIIKREFESHNIKTKIQQQARKQYQQYTDINNKNELIYKLQKNKTNRGDQLIGQQKRSILLNILNINSKKESP